MTTERDLTEWSGFAPPSLKNLFPVTPSAWPTDSGIASPHRYHGLWNLGVLLPGIAYRAAQPDPDGFQVLAEAVGEGRVLTVINLQAEYDDQDPPWRIGRIVPHLAYYRVPVFDEKAPHASQAEAFFGIVNQRANWPFIFHCKGGEGRAGLFAALIRYSWFGWAVRQIEAEIANFRRIRWQYHLDWVPILGDHYLRLSKPQRLFLREWRRTHAPGGLRPVM